MPHCSWHQNWPVSLPKVIHSLASMLKVRRIFYGPCDLALMALMSARSPSNLVAVATRMLLDSDNRERSRHETIRIHPSPDRTAHRGRIHMGYHVGRTQYDAGAA